jgi:Xaa-Pro aminopeptidase
MSTVQINHIPLDSETFSNRRQKFAALVRAKSGNGIAILRTSPEAYRNRDSDFPYRHDSDFYYLTGFTEPDSLLVMLIDGNAHTSHLFCRPKNLEREIWDGLRLGPDAAPETLKVDFAHSIDEIDQIVPDLMANQAHIYYRLAANSSTDQSMRNWMEALRGKARAGIKKPEQAHDIEQLIHEMRLFKEPGEIALMSASAKIAAQAHLQAMRICKPGLREYHLEAELLHVFRKFGAQSVAYNSIVATGANACILHYRAANTELRSGDLCLIDAGCELDSYASDITRTFPVNGKFSAAQKMAYEIVLAAQEAAIAATKPGKHFQEPHDAALKVLVEGLFEMKILHPNKHGTVEDAITSGAYQPYYMHRTSHWLGMDVHDVGSYREPGDKHQAWRTLRDGMSLTIEPGLYFRPSEEVPAEFWNIGIRIEDDAVITQEGCQLLSRDVPVSVAEIEQCMKGA